jgi:flagellar hook-length control protein FliK
MTPIPIQLNVLPTAPTPAPEAITAPKSGPGEFDRHLQQAAPRPAEASGTTGESRQSTTTEHPAQPSTPDSTNTSDAASDETVDQHDQLPTDEESARAEAGDHTAEEPVAEDEQVIDVLDLQTTFDVIQTPVQIAEQLAAVVEHEPIEANDAEAAPKETNTEKHVPVIALPTDDESDPSSTQKEPLIKLFVPDTEEVTKHVIKQDNAATLQVKPQTTTGDAVNAEVVADDEKRRSTQSEIPSDPKTETKSEPIPTIEPHVTRAPRDEVTSTFKPAQQSIEQDAEITTQQAVVAEQSTGHSKGHATTIASSAVAEKLPTGKPTQKPTRPTVDNSVTPPPAPSQGNEAVQQALEATTQSQEIATNTETSEPEILTESSAGRRSGTSPLTSNTSERGRHSTVSTADRVRFVQRVAQAFRDVGPDGGIIKLRLHPAELGSLQIEITMRDGVLSARLETETPAARTVLLDNLPALRDRLAEQDIKVEKFDVNVSDRRADDSQQGTNRNQDNDPNHAETNSSADDGELSQEDDTSPTSADTTGSDGQLNVVI